MFLQLIFNIVNSDKLNVELSHDVFHQTNEFIEC
jgi:hypothetical protein